MGILSRLGLRAKALSGTPAVLQALDSRQFNPYISLGSSPNASRAANQRIGGAYVAYQNASYGWIYTYQPSVRRVIEYVAENVAQLTPKVYKRVSDDEREHVGDHPAAEALRWPNSWTPGQHFIYDFVTDFLIYNNAYALKFPSDGGLTLVNIPPPLVGVMGRSLYQPEGYEIRDQDGNAMQVPVERMVHWRGKNPADPRRGESKLETLREELAADSASRQATTELYRSGLSLQSWIERPLEAPEWTDDALKRLRESATAQAKKGTREIPVFEEGMSLKQGGITPEDAELLAARRFTVEQIAGLYGMKNVPPESEEERKQFYADVLPPITEILAAFLDLHVLIREYNATDHYFEFNLDEKLMGDDRLKALTSAAGAPILLRDEARARLNLPALPDGQGQEIITPSNVAEGGKPSIDVMPVQNPLKPPQDGSHRSGDADKPMAAGGRASLNGHAKAAPLIPRRRKAGQRRDRWAPEYQGVLDRHFDRQRRSLKSKKARPKAITDDRWNTELGGGLNDVASRQFEAEGAHIAFRLASTFDPDQGENWLAAKSIGAAQAINLTTQQHADETDLDQAFSKAMTRSAGAAMAYATDIAAFSTKVATEQAPGEPTVIVDGGTCDVCAPYQGSWPASELEAWPAYHPSCACVVDVEGGVEGGKSLELRPDPAVTDQTKAIQALAHAVANGQQDEGIRLLAKAIAEQQPPNLVLQVAEGAFKAHTPVTVEPAEVHVAQPVVNVAPAELHVHEGAFNTPVTVAPPPPAEVNVAPAVVNVAPAVVHIEEGAVAPVTNIEAAPQPDINFAKGALHVESPVHVEAPPPADFRIAEGAIQVDVKPGDVNVMPPNVNVEVKGGKSKRTVTFSDGRTAQIDEEEASE